MALEALIAAVLLGAAGMADTAVAAEEDKVICKQQARTNTRFARKVCHTKAEWAKIAEANRRMAEEMINRPSINRPDNN